MANQKLTFGLSCSPSEITDTQELAATKFLVSYGGGMGGANQTHYALDYKTNDKFYVLELLNGNQIKINPRFIVSMQDKKVLRIENDVTAHSNYREKNCEKYIIVNYYAMDDTDTYTIDKNQFDSKLPTAILSEKNKI